MKFDSNFHERRSMRLKGYDYTQSGMYLVTLVSWQREEIFGQVIDNELILSALGQILHDEWLHSNEIRREIQLFEDEFIIMPNHLHGIVNIVQTGTSCKIKIKPCNNPVTAQNEQEETSQFNLISKSLGSFIAGFKSSVTRRAINEIGICSVWQRNYYDHIIRNDGEYDRLWNYINDNPRRWIEDQLHPNASPNRFNKE